MSAAKVVERLSLNPTAPLLPWPELSQDLAFIASVLDAQNKEIEKLTRERDCAWVGLLAAILPNLDPKTAEQVQKRIRELAGVE